MGKTMAAQKGGFTLIELIVVMIIIGVVAAIGGYTAYMGQTQRAYSQAAYNNLIAIYSAQLHYFNNHNGYCLMGGCADNLQLLNTNLNLSLQDSGNYMYICCTDQSGFACGAASTAACNTSGTLLLGGATQLQVVNGPITTPITDGANPSNPTCNVSAPGAYCPYV